jgi:hypothetical protein
MLTYKIDTGVEFAHIGFTTSVIEITNGWKSCNEYITTIPIANWKKLSNTTISTCISDYLCWFIDEQCQDCMLNEHEKGYPDLIPSNIDKNNTIGNGRYKSGAQIKITCRDSWAAHHPNVKNLLGGIWNYLDGIPQVVGLFYIDELTEDDFTTKQETKHNMNTPSCTIRGGELQCVGIVAHGLTPKIINLKSNRIKQSVITFSQKDSIQEIN